MRFSIDILFEELKKSYKSIYLNSACASNRNIDDVLLLGKNMSTIEKNHLYVGTIDKLPAIENIPFNTNFLLIGKNTFSEKHYDFNFIIIEGKQGELISLFNNVQSIVQKLFCWRDSIDNIANKEYSMEDFITISKELIPYPMLIIDIARNELFISSCLQNNSFDESIIFQQFKSEIFYKSKNTDYLSKEVDKLYFTFFNMDYLVNPLHVNEHLIGFVAICKPISNDKKFSRGIEQLLHYLSKRISKKMSENEKFKFSKDFVLASLLADILDGKIKDRNSINDRLLFADWKLNQEARIGVISTIENLDNNLKTREILKNIERILPHAKTIYHKDKFVILQSLANDDIFKKSNEKSFLDFLSKSNAICGISARFSDICLLNQHYIQAEKAIKFGSLMNPSEKVHWYRDYIQEHMYDNLSEYYDLRVFIHPDIKHLLEYNVVKPYIFETLKALTDNDFNVQIVSKEMYIHKNTLNYRIKQIENLIDISFNDSNIRNIFTQSMKLINYMQNFLNYDIFTNSYKNNQDKN